MSKTGVLPDLVEGFLFFVFLAEEIGRRREHSGSHIQMGAGQRLDSESSGSCSRSTPFPGCQPIAHLSSLVVLESCWGAGTWPPLSQIFRVDPPLQSGAGKKVGEGTVCALEGSPHDSLFVTWGAGRGGTGGKLESKEDVERACWLRHHQACSPASGGRPLGPGLPRASGSEQPPHGHWGSHWGSAGSGRLQRREVCCADATRSVCSREVAGD